MAAVSNQILIPSMLTLGDLRLETELRETLSELDSSLDIAIHPRSIQQQDLYWPRDYSVRRLDGTQLIPYPLNEHSQEKFEFLVFPLPQDKNPYAGFNPNGYGRGITGEDRISTRQFYNENDTAVFEGKSCIEGGNCFLFTDKDGIEKAVIGFNSVITTVLALEEQSFFDDLDLSTDAIDEISDDAYIGARNESYFNEHNIFDVMQKKDRLQKSETCDPKDYRELMITLREYRNFIKQPLKESDKEKYHDQALLLEAKYCKAKEVIANEIQIPFENIAFIRQRRMHIDLEMLALPEENIVLVHSLKEAKKAVRGHMQDFFYDVIGNQSCFDPINQKNQQALKKIGFQVKYVAGFFLGKGINFLNAIRLPNQCILSNGVEKKYEFLQDLFRAAIPESYQVSFLGRGKLQLIFQQNRGGIRCLTQFA